MNANLVQGEEQLVGPGAGGGTTRLGDTVRRTPERAPAAMRLVLRHLETVGFNGCPRLRGCDEQGRWILTYIPGHVALPPWPEWVAADTTLVSVAKLLRRFHEAVAGLRPPAAMRWPTRPPSGYEGNVVGHMDVSMANVVCRRGEAVALIDFEEVGMVAPVWDAVRTARHWVPLIDPADLTGGLLGLAGRQAARLGLFLDAYALGDVDRARFLDAVLLSADVTYERMRQGAAAGHPGYTREWTGHAAVRNRRGRRWVEAHRRELKRVVNG
jgi:hypothetical protein